MCPPQVEPEKQRDAGPALRVHNYSGNTQAHKGAKGCELPADRENTEISPWPPLHPTGHVKPALEYFL